jgi:hypothetical protein
MAVARIKQIPAFIPFTPMRVKPLLSLSRAPGPVRRARRSAGLARIAGPVCLVRPAVFRRPALGAIRSQRAIGFSEPGSGLVTLRSGEQLRS